MSSFFTPSFAPLSGEILIYKLELGASSGHKNERVKVGNHIYIYKYIGNCQKFKAKLHFPRFRKLHVSKFLKFAPGFSTKATMT